VPSAFDVLVDRRELERPDTGERLRRVLASVNAAPADDDRVQLAAALGLQLFRVPGPDADLPALVRRLREVAPNAAGLNTVLVAGPQRHGGDSPPRPDAPPEDIPGLGDGGAGQAIAVLDTGVVETPRFGIDRAPVDVEPLAELPPGTLGPAVGHGTFVAGIVNRHARAPRSSPARSSPARPASRTSSRSPRRSWRCPAWTS
jgi:hypothetical protein